MRGLVLAAVGHVAYRTDLPDPQIVVPTDAVVAVRRAGLCGSDLHPYAGREAVRPGLVCGHEIVGHVVATGDAVTTVHVGDRVLAAFTTSCGQCGPCRRGLTARCLRGQLFGFGSVDAPDALALPGGQAELVRVPLADTTLVAVPDQLDDTAAVLLTDNLPTAWYAVERAATSSDAVTAVVGLGSVGLCAVAAARRHGVEIVLGIDPVVGRRRAAAQLGAMAAAPEDAVTVLTALGDGEAAGSVIDAAGTVAGQRLAWSLVRPGGTLSVVAVQTASDLAFTPVEAYDRNLTVRFGRASVRAVLERMLPTHAALARRVADVVVSESDTELADGPATYRRFAAREPGLIKAVFAP